MFLTDKETTQIIAIDYTKKNGYFVLPDPHGNYPPQLTYLQSTEVKEYKKEVPEGYGVGDFYDGEFHKDTTPPDPNTEVDPNQAFNMLLGVSVDEPITLQKATVNVDTMRALTYLTQKLSTDLTDEEALTCPNAFEVWAPDKYYRAQQIINHKTQLYRCPNEVTSKESEPPDKEGMLAVYRPIALGHKGTIDDPIPYVYGMDCFSFNEHSPDGKNYYSENGKTYRCAGDMLPCVWPPSEYAGVLWHWVEV